MATRKNFRQKIGENLEYGKESVEGFIKERPVTSIAVAAAVGALVALGVNALFHHKEEKSFYRRFRDYF